MACDNNGGSVIPPTVAVAYQEDALVLMNIFMGAIFMIVLQTTTLMPIIEIVYGMEHFSKFIDKGRKP